MKLTDCSGPSIWLRTAMLLDACTVPNASRKTGTSWRVAAATVTCTGGGSRARGDRGAASCHVQAAAPATRTSATPARKKERRRGRPAALLRVVCIASPPGPSLRRHLGSVPHGNLTGTLKKISYTNRAYIPARRAAGRSRAVRLGEPREKRLARRGAWPAGGRSRRRALRIALVRRRLGRRRRPSRPLLLDRVNGRRLVIHDGAPGGAVEVIVLAALERPQKAGEAKQAEGERHGHEEDQDFHGHLALSAFAVTNTEDPDMAIAATSGVASPTMAIGTAMKL